MLTDEAAFFRQVDYPLLLLMKPNSSIPISKRNVSSPYS